MGPFSPLSPLSPSYDNATVSAQSAAATSSRSPAKDTRCCPSHFFCLDCGSKGRSRSLLQRALGTDSPAIQAGFVDMCAQALANVALSSAILAVHATTVNWVAGFEAHVRPIPDATWTQISLAYRSLLSYHVIFLMAQVFLLFIYLEAVANSNTVEIIAFFIVQVCCFSYTVVQIFQEVGSRDMSMTMWPTLMRDPGSVSFPVAYNESHRVLVIVQAAVNGFFLLTWVLLGWRIYQTIGWQKFRRLGASKEVVRRMWWHHVHQVFLKVAGFFFLSFAVQWTMLVLFNPAQNFSAGYIAGMAVGIFSLVVLGAALGFLSLRTQSPALQAAFLFLLLAGAGYICYILWLVRASPSAPEYEGAVGGMTWFLAGALSFALCTLATGAVNLYFMHAGPRLSFRELEGEEKGKETMEGAMRTASFNGREMAVIVLDKGKAEAARSRFQIE
ncbi:hypothetical protein DFJ74DRAFT_665675 [Hyaloraphidium curvatum]|nr:hypothetical protein DFJ74DRAFT_665675 [Hyaloraphidium curvatum]